MQRSFGCNEDTVVTFGIWDLLHVGHLEFLQRARKLRNTLVVGVPTDRAVEIDKGKLPIICAEHRVQMLRSISFVTHVELYGYPRWFMDILRMYRPLTLAVGEDWGKADRHREAEDFMYSIGGIVVSIPRTPGISTTEIINRILTQRSAT